MHVQILKLNWYKEYQPHEHTASGMDPTIVIVKRGTLDSFLYI